MRIIEMTVAIQQVLERAPTLCGVPTWRDTLAIRGPPTVPAVFAKSPASGGTTG